MKKSYIKLTIFNVVLIVLLLLNNFISNILNYTNLIIFFVISLVAFKLLFGYEKDNHRYVKDIIFNMLIIFLVFFIVYYICGLFIGFVKTTNYYTLDGLTKMIIPYILVIVLKEYLRYQMLVKSGDSKLLIILTFITFVLFDISGSILIRTWTNHYAVFMFVSLTLLPALSINVVCSYIVRKLGYKPNILWVLIFKLYAILLPIVPNTGVYIGAMINFLLPIGIMYNVYTFLSNRQSDVPSRDKDYKKYFAAPLLLIIILIIVYFTSGYFKYFTIAIATGSMTPQIYKGDVVVVNQKYDIKDVNVGEVIAYKYGNSIIVHRLVEKEKVGNEYYMYTKGDANENKDGYIIYENMIIGVVHYKIPYIGLPTVWLNEL